MRVSLVCKSMGVINGGALPYVGRVTKLDWCSSAKVFSLKEVVPKKSVLFPILKHFLSHIGL